MRIKKPILPCKTLTVVVYVTLFTFVYIILSLLLLQCNSTTVTQAYEELLQVDKDNNLQLIVPLHKYGFANRMRTLASFVYLSKLLKRKLYISWKKTPECFIDIQDIFEFKRLDDNNQYFHHDYFTLYQQPLRKYDDYSSSSSSSSSSSNNNDNNKRHTNTIDVFLALHGKQKYYEDEHIFYKTLVGFQLLDVEAYKTLKQKIVIFVHDGWFVPMDTLTNINNNDSNKKASSTRNNCLDFFMYKKHFYKSFILSQSIQHSINKIWSALKGRVIVGIHIRKTDEKHDWPTVASTVPKTFLNFNDVVSNSQYINVMKQISIHIPNVYFYIASNSIETKEFFKTQEKAEEHEAYFKNKFYFLDIPDQKLNRYSLDGMELAIVEFYILSKTELIISTYGSSFGQEASFLGSIPELLLRNGGYIYHENNILLPNCNNDQIAAINTDGSTVITKEEHVVKYSNGNLVITPSSNKNNQPFNVKKVACESFKLLWGVDDVYC